MYNKLHALQVLWVASNSGDDNKMHAMPQIYLGGSHSNGRPRGRGGRSMLRNKQQTHQFCIIQISSSPFYLKIPYIIIGIVQPTQKCDH